MATQAYAAGRVDLPIYEGDTEGAAVWRAIVRAMLVGWPVDGDAGAVGDAIGHACEL